MANIELLENVLYDKAVSIIDSGRKKIVETIYNESTKSYYLLESVNHYSFFAIIFNQKHKDYQC